MKVKLFFAFFFSFWSLKIIQIAVSVLLKGKKTTLQKGN